MKATHILNSRLYAEYGVKFPACRVGLPLGALAGLLRVDAGRLLTTNDPKFVTCKVCQRSRFPAPCSLLPARCGSAVTRPREARQ